MDHTLLIAIAAVIFVLGIFFIIRGMTVEEERVIPISNMRELEEFKRIYKSPGKKAPLKSEGQNVPKPLLATMPMAEKGPFREDTDKQIRELMEKNKQLRVQLDSQKDKFEQLEKSISVLKAEQNKGRDSDSEAVKNLEEKIVQLQQEKEELLTSRELSGELKSKNNVLQSQYDESQAHQAEMRVIIDRLERETKELLKTQQLGVDKSELEMLNNRLSGSIAAIEVLKQENKELKQSKKDMEDQCQQAESYNSQLLEKEKRMQFELVKNRAQALGLEKICEDFKVQIETMAETASAN